MASTITRPSITDDDGSGTLGTIDDAAFWDDIFDKIDQMFAGAGAYATFVFGGAVSLNGILTATINNASFVNILDLWNTNTTNNTGACLRFVTKDAGGTDRVAGYYGIRVTDHSSGAIIAQHEWLNKTGSTLMTLSQAGVLKLHLNHLEIGNSGAVIFWTSSTELFAPANGQLKLTNAGATAGVLLRFSTDALLEVRNRANSAFANVQADTFIGDLQGNADTADGYSGSGVSDSGNFTNFTFVNGFCTSAS